MKYSGVQRKRRSRKSFNLGGMEIRSSSPTKSHFTVTWDEKISLNLSLDYCVDLIDQFLMIDGLSSKFSRVQKIIWLQNFTYLQLIQEIYIFISYL